MMGNKLSYTVSDVVDLVLQGSEYNSTTTGVDAERSSGGGNF